MPDLAAVTVMVTVTDSDLTGLKSGGHGVGGGGGGDGVGGSGGHLITAHRYIQSHTRMVNADATC